jgi:2'-5' RNA ligase
MRLFVALAIPEDTREKLASLLREFKNTDPAPRWIPPQNLHVTLKFLGEVAPERITAICDALAEIRLGKQIHLEFRGLGFFPNARSPSVLWNGIESSEELARLASAIDRALGPPSIALETKPFVPHLTIARFKQPQVSSALRAEIAKHQNCTFGTVSAAEFHLMESTLKSGGAEYTTLRSFGFTDQGTKDS